MRINIEKKYRVISALLSLAISMTIHFSLIATVFFDNGFSHHVEEFSPAFVVFELSVTFLISYTIFLLNYFLLVPFKPHVKLHLKKIAMALSITFAVTLILVFFFLLLKGLFSFTVDNFRHKEELLSRNIFAMLLVLISVFFIHLIYQKQTIELENEMLKRESLQSRYESLKNQVSPHFLFNSLTALKTLLQESPKLADQYVNHLAQVLRYTLQSNKWKTVCLEEELEFVLSYIFLLKMRYETNLSVQTEISNNSLQFSIPPLTLQTLIENAVKHNEISKDFPLQIVIKSINEQTIQVKNKIREKLTPEDGTGIGLTNLNKLYHLLGDYEIQITKDDLEFAVDVPLIKT
ncbi:histidine kinase [Prolixibacteraceae bacterium Z1-6]|uniref:Histidine kinase n=1 Tax=Draconibacterium aestuarii TaxID=2998507 RepID=A0A9X3F9K3_9BACT|nr:histidine kinase [Prolixibacteraceae bacterium Z1-6]